MPIYKIDIDRRVVKWDRFTRFVSAPDEAAARIQGDRLAGDANQDCPDDAIDSGHDVECEAFQVERLAVADAVDLAGMSDEEMAELDEEAFA